jgi:eukaryotic-like serine/threonine-protein kinase
VSTRTPDANGAATSTPMTPERWRMVEDVLNAALACAPARRGAVVAAACAGEEALRREVESLLPAHDRAAHDDFLERPAAEALGAPGASPLTERLAAALEGRYVVERELAHGGMATVYLARDVRHHRRVAIKVLREELAAAVGADRFLEEIRVTASLQHPHILPLFDSGSAEFPPEVGGRVLWYVMPFVEGETLRSRLAREGRLPVDVALQLAREMADALEYAHRHGVVHRDVKPENVLLQSGHALVADFGIALALEHAGGDRLTHTGITLGTPQYMAPEQAAGGRDVDARTDVYALGAVLHEMLAGESPFAAESQHAVLRRVMNETPTALASRRADVSSFLDAAVRRALAKRPDDRFPSAATFAAALALPAGHGDAGSGAPGQPSDADARSASTGGARAERRGGRQVSARAAMYAAGAMLAIGLAGGWVLARAWVAERDDNPVSKVVASFMNGGGTPEPRIAARSAAAEDLTLAVVDRAGRPQRTIVAERPWTPRFSPDGRRLAYGAFGTGRHTSDLWVMDLDAGTTKRVTDDGDDSNDPQWSGDGKSIAYSASADGGKDVMTQRIDGLTPTLVASRPGTQFPSDWLRDGSALLVTEEAGGNKHDILVQPADGGTPRAYAATAADESAARISPDGRWVAYTSDETGRAEVYIDSYEQPGRHVLVSLGGGIHPVWRGDGRELYYWNNEALLAVRLGESRNGAPPTIETRTLLFRAPYPGGVSTMYDVSPDGQRFVIVRPRETRKY